MTELIIPGLNGSGAEHWQSWWLHTTPGARVVEQRDWSRPRADAWSERLAGAVEAEPGAILIAHSLGCVLVAELAARRPDLLIGGALLVAPADVEGSDRLLDRVAGFGPIPRCRLPFPSIIVASRNDPYVTFSRAHGLAAAWGSRFIDLGKSGHINVESGFGPWPAGKKLAHDLASATPLDARPPPVEGFLDDEKGRAKRITLSEILSVGLGT